LNISPLLRELILHACKFRILRRKVKAQARLIAVLVDQLSTVQAIPLQLPSPLDPRALRLADALSRDPSNSAPLEQICRSAGASKRTLERLFQQETRLSLGRWRQQLRLLRSLQLLAGGGKITHVALEAGYSTPSAFIAMFRKILGITPGRYFENS
jgi:AraC-like DNA-binding protein